MSRQTPPVPDVPESVLMQLVLDIQSLRATAGCAALVATRVQSSRSWRLPIAIGIVLLLNGSYADDSQALMEELLASWGPEYGCLQEKHTTTRRCHRAGLGACSATHLQSTFDPSNLVRESLSELLREAFIGELEPDLVRLLCDGRLCR